MSLGFPFARTIVVVRSERTDKKTATSSKETRYYLSNRLHRELSSKQWLDLIRGHWGGVENRNHWRRDALMGEDRSRSRNPTLLANLALLRNALLHLLPSPDDAQSLPQMREFLQQHPQRCLKLLNEL